MLYLPISQSNIHKYTFSSVEQKAIPQIYTDHLLDQNIDLVNPQTYAVPDYSDNLQIAKEDYVFLAPPEIDSSQNTAKSITQSLKI